MSSRSQYTPGQATPCGLRSVAYTMWPACCGLRPVAPWPECWRMENVGRYSVIWWNVFQIHIQTVFLYDAVVQYHGGTQVYLWPDCGPVFREYTRGCCWNTEIQGYRDRSTGTHEYRSAGTLKYRDTRIQGLEYRDTLIQECRNIEIQRYRDRNIGTHEYRSAGTLDTEIQGYRDRSTGTH